MNNKHPLLEWSSNVFKHFCVQHPPKTGLFLTSAVSNLILPLMLRRAVLASATFGQKYEASGFVPGDKLLLNSGFWPQALTSAHFTLFHQSEVKTLGTFSGSACHSNLQPPSAPYTHTQMNALNSNIISAFSVTAQCDVGTFYLQINTLSPWQRLCEVCFQSSPPPAFSFQVCWAQMWEGFTCLVRTGQSRPGWRWSAGHQPVTWQWVFYVSTHVKQIKTWNLMRLLPYVFKRCSHMGDCFPNSSASEAYWS